VSDDLLHHWWSTHTRKGTLRKNLNIALIDAPGAWAYKNVWNTDTQEHSEKVHQYGNEL